MVASCSTNDKGKSQRKNLGNAGRWELAIGRSVSGTTNAAVARLESMDCHPERSEGPMHRCGTMPLQRSFAALRMTRSEKVFTMFLQEHFTYVIVRTFTRLYVQLWWRDAATTAAGTASRYIVPPRCGGGAAAGGASGAASWRGATYGTLGRCVTWPRAASAMSMPA